ncbi:hypothetical protein AGOR_G00129260 [Albula goreensis]|uniref:Single-pass membrane and coiled-coil domain-containing protein 4 n=1 Tax=Albula goreensis TaxID=1534307 RepID=A0A8T3DCW8_9TELE|nr:hypothetical protein AGOR_G00129260 [Albula goreensis]
MGKAKYVRLLRSVGGREWPGRSVSLDSRERPAVLAAGRSVRKGGSHEAAEGKPKKETSKDKKERKQAMQEARQQIATVVLPTLAVVVLLIVVFVYVATRPGAIE